MSTSTNNPLLAVVFAVIGGFMVLLSDFAGWTEPTYYGMNDYYVFIGSENAPVFGQLLVAIMGLSLLATGYFAYRYMNDQDPVVLQKAYQASLGALILVVFGALLFFIIAWDAVYSWLDVGFYEGLIGSGVSFYFLRQVKLQ